MPPVLEAFRGALFFCGATWGALFFCGATGGALFFCGASPGGARIFREHLTPVLFLARGLLDTRFIFLKTVGSKGALFRLTGTLFRLQGKENNGNVWEWQTRDRGQANMGCIHQDFSTAVTIFCAWLRTLRGSWKGLSCQKFGRAVVRSCGLKGKKAMGKQSLPSPKRQSPASSPPYP